MVALDIVKLTVWFVPGQAEREERWDAEIVRDTGGHERATGVPEEVVGRLIQEVIDILKKKPVLKSRTR